MAKALRLSNGDVVTVALVPKIGATSNPASGIGWNIGMVRYNDAGVKQKWTNASASFTDSTKSYYVFPNSDAYHSNGSYTGIYDVKEHDGWIYVLARRYRSASSAANDVRVVRFQLSSSRWVRTKVFENMGTNEYGVGMHFFTDGGFDRLTVAVGRKVVSGKTESWLKSYLVGNLAALTVDTTFGSSGVKRADPSGCTNCRVQALAASATEVGVTYLAGSYVAAGDERYGYVTKFDKKGTRIDSFGSSGTKSFQFPSDLSSTTSAIKDMVVGEGRTVPQPTYFDRIYVLASVSTVCSKTAAGVVKFNSNGSALSSFGTANGMLVFGGTNRLVECTAPYWMKPHAMALNGNRLAIVGYSTRTIAAIPSPFNVGGPSFSVVDSDIGYVSDSRVLKPTGVNIGDNGGGGASAFLAVVSSESDSFYAVGDARDTKNQKKNVPMTARVRADRIFGDGME